MNNSKRILSLVLLATALTACGGGNSDSSGSNHSQNNNNNNNNKPDNNSAKIISTACAVTDNKVSVTKTGCIFNTNSTGNAQTALCSVNNNITTYKILTGTNITLENLEKGQVFSGATVTLNGKTLTCV